MITITDKELIDIARKMKDKSYSPYSKFRVGAALLTSNGKLFTGTNIENSAYSATCCAERVAIFKAISEGNRNLKKIAIDGDDEGFTFPCGECRQVLSEFNDRIEIVLANKKNEIRIFNLNELFPYSFKLCEDD